MKTIETTIRGLPMTFHDLLEEDGAQGCKTCALDANDLCLHERMPCGTGSLIAADDETKRNLAIVRTAIRWKS